MFQATKFTQLFQFSSSASAFRARLRIVGFVYQCQSDGVTRNELTRRFPHASPSFIKANLDTDDSGPCSVVESNPGPEPLETNQAEEAAASRIHIRFVSVRKRLCDPDNLSAKWLLDCLRYCGAIRDDKPENITFEIGQRKCAKGEAEHTTIELTCSPSPTSG